MKLFFVEEVTPTLMRLGIEESDHLVRVLRMQIGDEVYLTNGRGDMWRASIRSISKKGVELEPLAHHPAYRKRSYTAHVGIAPTKSADRFEWFLEKAVEIGVDEITPLFCRHSERRKLNMSRGKKIIRSAVKQSMKAYLPILNEPLDYRDFISSSTKFGRRFIAHCNTNFERRPLKGRVESGMRFYTILIGPEGDFSPDELELALSLGWQGAQLGRARLRTETAAIAALHTLALCFEDAVEGSEGF